MPFRSTGVGLLIISGDTLHGQDALAASGSAGSALALVGGAGDGAGAGGVVSINAGAAGASGVGGAITLQAGAGGGSNSAGGAITITSGTGSATNGAGGALALAGGAADGSGIGGAVTIDGGAADVSGAGGGLLISSGAGGSTSGNGGVVQLTAAAAPTSGDGGDIELRAGSGSDDNGRVIITPNFSNADTDEYITLVGTGSNPPNSGGTQDVRILAGNRDPDESVVATPGSLYLRGSSTGSLLYVNITSGTAPGSSWTQLAAGAITRQQAYDGGATVVTGGAIAWSTTGSASWELKSSAAAGAIEGTLVTVTGTGSSGGVAITASNAAGFIVVDAGGSISMISQAGDTTITSAAVLELNAVTRVDMDTPELAWGDGTTAATVTWTTTTGQPNEAQPTGSIKIVNGASIGQVWSKVGTGNTDWDLLNGGVSVPVFAVSGVLTTGGKPFRYRSRVAGTIVRVQITVGTAPTGEDDIIVDVNKGGTTIFTTQSNRPVIAENDIEGNTTTIEVATVAVNDEFTVAVDQIGSTIAGSDLLVEIEIAVNQ